MSSKENAVLEMRNIQKTCGQLEVLRGVDLTLYQGETLAIIGPSGAGKSTLLRCAAQLTEISGGSIRCLGQQVAETDAGGRVRYAPQRQLKLVRAGCGMVFQGFRLFPHFSVLKNLTDPQRRVLGRSREEAEEKARALLEKVGLADKAEAWPSQLSGGQQQRAAIARALCMEPRLLFFDEPTSALDPELTAEVLGLIRRLSDEGITMAIVTHQLRFAREAADRVMLLEDGCVVEEGPAEQLFSAPTQLRTRQFLRSMGE